MSPAVMPLPKFSHFHFCKGKRSRFASSNWVYSFRFFFCFTRSIFYVSLTVVVEKCNSASGHGGCVAGSEWRECRCSEQWLSVPSVSRLCGRNAHAKEKWNIGTRAPPHSSPNLTNLYKLSLLFFLLFFDGDAHFSGHREAERA